MIYTISVPTGDSRCAVAAQRYAIELARRFQAKLRVAGIWDPEVADKMSTAGENPEEGARLGLQMVLQKAKDADVLATGALSKESFSKALLAESQRSDLLVIGMPTEGCAEREPSVEAILQEGRSLLREAECSVLVVCQVPQPIRKVLVDYQGGMEGKRALHTAGELALRNTATVVVCSTKDDVSKATQLTAVAQEYLEGFRLLSVDIAEPTGSLESGADIIEVAKSLEADIIVIGEESWGFLDRLLGRTPTEEVALATMLPVLIAR